MTNDMAQPPLTLLVILLAVLATSPCPIRAAEEEGRPEVTRDVTYVRRDKVALAATVYVPRGEGPFPGVLMVHGGAWSVGHRSHMHTDAMQVAKQGYTVVSISYRLAPKHPFPAQLDDCASAVRWMREEATTYKMDPQRIAGYGYSAGGHLVSLLGAIDHTDNSEDQQTTEPATSARLQAVVAGGAPCDFRWLPEDSNRLAYWLGGTRRNVPEAYRKASPLAFVSKDDPPMFFYHGESDKLVPVASPRIMQAGLIQVGVTAELHVIQDAGHMQAFIGRKAVPAAISFLDRVLKPHASPTKQTGDDL